MSSIYRERIYIVVIVYLVSGRCLGLFKIVGIPLEVRYIDPAFAVCSISAYLIEYSFSAKVARYHT